MDKIAIRLKLFAVYQEVLGEEEMALSVPVGTTARQVCDRLIADYPELAKWRDLTRFGINLQFVEPDTPLHSDDELVLIPPVSGG